MKERWKTIRTGLLIIALAVVGLLEYVQLVQTFDLPQVILVMPIVGLLAVLLLKKVGFAVPVSTLVLAVAYQILAGDANALTELSSDAGSVASVILRCGAILLLFELLGMGGGALIRVLIKKKKGLAVGIACAVAGVVLVFAPYVVLFQNPLYPWMARHKLTAYAEAQFTDYPIAEKTVYYSMQHMDYRCRVAMSDGKIRVVCFDENGDATEE